MTVTCICCHHTQEFPDEEAAFQAGWDTPTYFPEGTKAVGGVLCPLCPMAHIIITGSTAWHQEIHERWKGEGRPEAFSLEHCVPVKDQPKPGDPFWGALLQLRDKILSKEDEG